MKPVILLVSEGLTGSRRGCKGGAVASVDGMGGRAGRLLGVCVGSYEDAAHQSLDFACAEVGACMALAGGFSAVRLSDPVQAEVLPFFEKLPRLERGEPVILVWCGHGKSGVQGELRLLAKDSDTSAAAGV